MPKFPFSACFAVIFVATVIIGCGLTEKAQTTASIGPTGETQTTALDIPTVEMPPKVWTTNASGIYFRYRKAVKVPGQNVEYVEVWRRVNDDGNFFYTRHGNQFSAYPTGLVPSDEEIKAVITGK